MLEGVELKPGQADEEERERGKIVVLEPGSAEAGEEVSTDPVAVENPVV
jgi:hypothetical protein